MSSLLKKLARPTKAGLKAATRYQQAKIKELTEQVEALKAELNEARSQVAAAAALAARPEL